MRLSPTEMKFAPGDRIFDVSRGESALFVRYCPEHSEFGFYVRYSGVQLGMLPGEIDRFRPVGQPLSEARRIVTLKLLYPLADAGVRWLTANDFFQEDDEYLERPTVGQWAKVVAPSPLIGKPVNVLMLGSIPRGCVRRDADKVAYWPDKSEWSLKAGLWVPPAKPAKARLKRKKKARKKSAKPALLPTGRKFDFE